jgi:hypothetical protein
MSKSIKEIRAGYISRQIAEERTRSCPKCGAQSRSRKLGLPFNITIENITIENIVIPEFCPILGIKLNVGSGKVSDASPSLDKVIPGLGYVRGNIQVISNRANRIKTDATLNELKKVYEFYKGLLGEPPNE